MTDLPEHVAVNRAHWDDQADDWVAAGEASWAAPEPRWGIWQVPESEIGLLPTDMTGMHTIELGCGTGYVSRWMEQRGAVVTGIDNSERQLATARRLAARHGSAIKLIHGNAEEVPAPDSSFDFAISEYGAVLWCDPYKWVPEAYRLLRPGGRLVLLSQSTLSVLCSPVDGTLPVSERLERDYFSIHRIDWRDAVDDPGGIEFNLPISSWFRLFRETGFEVEDFLEIQAPGSGQKLRFFTTADWARRFPSEQAWKVRKPRPQPR